MTYGLATILSVLIVLGIPSLIIYLMTKYMK